MKKSNFSGFLKKLLCSPITIAIIMIYIIFGAILFFKQTDFIYFPDKQDFDSCKPFADTKKINFNGTRMYFRQGSDKLIVFYHGNAGSACSRATLKSEFDRLGISYLFVEYAGYSNDTIKPEMKLILNDVSNANNLINSKNYTELIIMGESIGTGPASFHSNLAFADKVILIAPFSSLKDYAKMRFFMYPVSMMLKENYDNELWLKGYNGRLLILHGDSDSTISPHFSEKLFGSVPASDKSYILIPGAGHNDIYQHNATLSHLADFIMS